MVVGRYRTGRTISFPNLNPGRPNHPPSKSYHVRSTSLPCGGRTHPLIPQLNGHISLLLSWPHSKPILTTSHTTSSWLVNGLTQLKTLLDALDHLLQIPLAQASLSQSGSGARFVDGILERCLHLLDAFGIFHTCLLALKQELSSAQVALRRKDDAKLVSYLRFHKKAAKDMAKLLSTVLRSVDNFPDGGDQSDEISAAIRDVLDLTASVLAAVFGSVLASLGPIRSSACSWVVSLMGLRRKRGDEERKGELKKMEEMGESIELLEKASGRVLRSLICTRVSLLNILTHL